MTLTTESAFRKDRSSGYARLQHRHFATIAAIIYDMPSSGPRDETGLSTDPRLETALHFAQELRRTNPKFDRSRFLKACGVEQ